MNNTMFQIYSLFLSNIMLFNETIKLLLVVCSTQLYNHLLVTLLFGYNDW